MINILLNGCNGKMGQEFTNTVAKYHDLKIVAGVNPSGQQKNDYPVFESIMECTADFDVLVDFSIAESIDDVLAFSLQKNKPIFVGTTGHTKIQKEKMKECSNSIPIFLCANTSFGINILLEITKKVAFLLGDDFDIEIIEKHHNQKVDAPSGTSLLIANAVNEVLSNYEYIYDRHSKLEKRSKNEIGIHSIRGGTYPGEHTIIFAGNDEILEIKHTALSKSIFAEGAIKIVKYIFKKPAGLYSMQDLISL